MKVNSVNQINFGRAFTTKEKSDYKKLIADCRKELGIKDTTAIAFDFNIPSEEGKNTGIGSTWSESMKKFVPFLKDMTGITSIQLQPQGKISEGNTSPYSGTNFAYGSHIISLDKLTKKDYGCLLSEDRIRKIDDQYTKSKRVREYKTDYSYVLGEKGAQEVALKEAFLNFQNGLENKIPEIISLNKEFEKFKKDNEDWLRTESEFGLFLKNYGTDDMSRWYLIDVMLNKSYMKNTIMHKNRIDELKSMYGDNFEYDAFVQFLADKQQKEAHTYLKSQDIKLYGDCLIGFSPSEMWGNIDAFEHGQYYGGPDPNCTETNGIQTWGLPAVNYNKLKSKNDSKELGPAGNLLLDKYKKFFERYDGVRVDAAWQFITPFIYKQNEGEIQQVNIENDDKDIFFDILKQAEKETNQGKKDVFLELVGLSAGESRDYTLNKYPHLYTTAYAEYDENPTAFVQKGYQSDKFYVGVGCHDNDSLVNQAKDENKRNLHLSDMKKHFPPLDNDEKITESKFRKLKFAEIFTTPNQFFTLPDMFGMAERINVSGQCNDTNWTVRLPKDYEKFYFTQLFKGVGLNMPETLKTSMIMKEKNSKKAEELIEKCSEASEILKSEGPMTEVEANLAYKNGEIDKTFSY